MRLLRGKQVSFIFVCVSAQDASLAVSDYVPTGVQFTLKTHDLGDNFAQYS